MTQTKYKMQFKAPLETWRRPSIFPLQHILFHLFPFISCCLIVVPWSIITHLIYFFISHLWRFIVKESFMDPNYDLSCTLVQFRCIFKFNSLSKILGLVHLVAPQVQLTQLHLSLARLWHLTLVCLVAPQVQLTQLHLTLLHLVVL